MRMRRGGLPETELRQTRMIAQQEAINFGLTLFGIAKKHPNLTLEETIRQALREYGKESL